jgi:hypothetical protein
MGVERVYQASDPAAVAESYMLPCYRACLKGSSTSAYKGARRGRFRDGYNMES